MEEPILVASNEAHEVLWSVLWVMTCDKRLRSGNIQLLGKTSIE